MNHCTGTQDWRGGMRAFAHPRARSRSHTLLYGGRGCPEPAPRDTDQEEATGE
ncbi:hypothetical protein ACFYVR_01645 [Rhodococcus sp. NPDC003318]|uniref:hypothetical protein n=1 Tax=Rhodococcus sp. NPDC003318 TaxID=3364503 RepID=UPI003677E3A1